jgi:hypothetical protein
MDWALENWFWILIFVLFIVMHLFGHGGHGRHRNTNDGEKDKLPDQVVNESSGGHRH